MCFRWNWNAHQQQRVQTLSAFWLRSSVVSVPISFISERKASLSFPDSTDMYAVWLITVACPHMASVLRTITFGGGVGKFETSS
jgi:hypothetical protein